MLNEWDHREFIYVRFAIILHLISQFGDAQSGQCETVLQYFIIKYLDLTRSFLKKNQKYAGETAF